jgi:hypothetical protein
MFALCGWGCEGSALKPPARTKSAPPIFACFARCQTRAVPPPFIFLLPLTRSRRQAGVHAQTLRRNPALRRNPVRESDRVYLNHYRCPCGCEWTDEWDCTRDDRCLECDTSCSPHESEDVGERSDLSRSVRDACDLNHDQLPRATHRGPESLCRNHDRHRRIQCADRSTLIEAS